MADQEEDTRSDKDIYEEARQRLSSESRLDASNVYIDVDQGEITLRGAVANQDEKRIAEEALIPITGVMSVENQLQIHPNKPAHTFGPGQEEADKPSDKEDY